MAILYDTHGNLLDTLFHGYFEKGTTRITPITDSLDSGIYIYKFVTEDTTFTKKMTLIK